MQCSNCDQKRHAVKVPFIECTNGGRAMMQFTGLQIDPSRYSDFLASLPDLSARSAKREAMSQLQRQFDHDL